METIKYRNELKFLCSEQELALIERRIQSICRRDTHAGADGVYRVRSVYFDDYADSCYYENEDGTDPREKFRIRIYNGDTSHITLECKRKEHGRNHKFSCPLTWEQCSALLEGRYRLQECDVPVLCRLVLLQQTRHFVPKVIVEYERTPFVYPQGNVRITFDRNISGSAKVQDFGKARLQMFPVMPVGQHVLEVKYDEIFPDFIKAQAQIGNLQQTAFSKYYLCRRFCRQ